MGMPGMLVGLALGSIVALSVILLTAALMMRGQWDRLAGPPPATAPPDEEPEGQSQP